MRNITLGAGLAEIKAIAPLQPLAEVSGDHPVFSHSPLSPVLLGKKALIEWQHFFWSLVAHPALYLCLYGGAQSMLQAQSGELFYSWSNIPSWAADLQPHAPGFPCIRRYDQGPSQARRGSSSTRKFKGNPAPGGSWDYSHVAQPLMHTHTCTTAAQPYSTQPSLSHIVPLSTSGTYQTDSKMI